ncbi:hypothetical protein SCHPADRAFT_396725 [Schizopora paradoxa]|uniref:Uncharacterized protein n=1 Tax=Schizopora paradoxa TaxID=27342 RepID=A0A0H2RLN8_9AGAM|nr:hypothetical protein SCHPADRAFT_396725 [Schizopora paradoxa]
MMVLTLCKEILRDEADVSIVLPEYVTTRVDVGHELPESSPPNIFADYPSSSPPCYSQEEFADPTEPTLQFSVQTDRVEYSWEGLSSSPPQLPPYTSSPFPKEDVIHEKLPLSQNSAEYIVQELPTDNLTLVAPGAESNDVADNSEDQLSKSNPSGDCTLPSQSHNDSDNYADHPASESVDIQSNQYEADQTKLSGTTSPEDDTTRATAIIKEATVPEDFAEEPLQPLLPVVESSKAEKEPTVVIVGVTRKRSIEDTGTSLSPAPKRMTLESQKKQHQKLSTPFRSPLLQKLHFASSKDPSPATLDADVPSEPSVSQELHLKAPQTPLSNRSENSGPSTTPSSTKVLQPKFKSLLQSTPKATSQFKSPLSSSAKVPPATSFRPGASSAVKSLEAQLQTLKRAVQLRKSNEAEKLEALTKQWREAGREIAWDVWALVRDQAGEDVGNYNYPGTNAKSTSDWQSGQQQQGFKAGWGWADDLATSNRSWGWDNVGETHGEGEGEEAEVNSQELMSPSKLEAELYKALSQKSGVRRQSILPPTPRGAYYEQQRFAAQDDDIHGFSESDQAQVANEEGSPSTTTTSHAKSLGGMLTQLGIAHETLGWCEDEGDFVDA